jgi:flavodoxin
MKKMPILSLAMSLAMSFLMSNHTHAQQSPGNVPSDANNNLGVKKVLIVYLSRTKNTKAVAEIIQQQTGGKLVPLELATPYPENYRQTVDQVVHENETGYLPPLKTTIDSIGQYNIVFIGFPTWDMKMPPPMKSFLHKYDLGGKIVVPFNTNAGYGVGSGFQTVKQMCPNSLVLEGYSTKGGIEKDGVLFVIEGEKDKQVRDEVKSWLRRINISSSIEK